MGGASLLEADEADADGAWERFVNSRRGSAFATLSVGVITGCWITYVLLYPLSSLPLPRYALAGVVALGWYVDYFARSMLDRIVVLFGSVLVASVTAFVAYTLPASLGWHADPVLRRALYLDGLKQVSIFTLGALVLLVAGTLGAYVLRNAYREITY